MLADTPGATERDLMYGLAIHNGVRQHCPQHLITHHVISSAVNAKLQTRALLLDLRAEATLLYTSYHVIRLISSPQLVISSAISSCISGRAAFDFRLGLCL